MKGYTPDHDDLHTDGSLRRCVFEITGLDTGYDDEGWVEHRANSIAEKPLRKQLVICAAILVAEVERLDRQNSTEEAG